MNKKYILYFVPIIAITGYYLYDVMSTNKKVDYSTEIKPIINKNCIKCHGGVKQAGGFSLLFREEALAKTKSGKPAIVPFHPEKSDFIARLSHKDLEERMPFKGEPLSKDDINKLTQWVKEGAEWGNHWAYVSPKLIEPKTTMFSSFLSIFDFSKPNSKIDAYIDEKIEEEGLAKNGKADKAKLLRRVSLALTGVPASTTLANNYLQNSNEESYETLVDSLLNTKAYGERWATMWLDLARYSDSRGYQKDNARNIWKYRDWVIQAFNQNMPFDRFTTEQLAGDLFPNPTDNQLIATAFHRNTMNNDETGTVDEEFRVAAVLDRVSTTYEVWQSTTMACVQCHSHPYDPIKHVEYYNSMAFFNNSRDEDTQDEASFLKQYSGNKNTDFKQLTAWLNTNFPEKKKPWIEFAKTMEPRFHAHYADNYNKGTLLGDRQISLFPNGSCRLPNINLTGKTEFCMMYANKNIGGNMQIRLDNANGKIIGQFKCDTTAGKYDSELRFIQLTPTLGKHDLYLTAQNTKLTSTQDVLKIGWFTFFETFPAKNDSKEAESMKQKFFNLLADKKDDETEETPILIENHPDYFRKSFQFVRGNWLVHGNEVQPDTPKSLNPFTFEKNRKGLADWIMDKNNPLTARVIVNRIWEQLFGLGIVETLEDFGTQGAKPSHPELLDYLALKLANEYHWDLKKLIKEIVMSEAYQRSSEATNDQIAKDPYNKYLARAPRLRLGAEQIRDQALAVSGLLSKKMYGKPVMPYQPEGIWNAVNSNLKYEQSKGEDQYRRAIYGFQRRTSPYPSLLAFDAGSREQCQSRRIRTNTPLQPLVLMNDPVFLEMAKAIVKNLKNKNKEDNIHLISDIYKTLFYQKIDNSKLKSLEKLYEVSLSRFKKEPSKATDFVGPNTKPEAAALVVVVNTILSLDEWVTTQ